MPLFIPLPHRQRGIAAIEFALIAILMVLMLLGALVYWRAFQAQQSLTRAAGDGARTILSIVASGINNPCKSQPNQNLIEARIQQTVIQSLTLSSMPGTVPPQLTVDWSMVCSGTVKFQLTYQLPPLLNTTGLIGEPNQLSEKSEVHFTSML